MDFPVARRNFLGLLIVMPAGLLAACGSSDEPADGGVSSPVELPEPTIHGSVPSSEVPGTVLVGDDMATVSAILTYTESGGFTTLARSFQDPPIVLVADDGTVLTPAPTTQEYPGALLPRHNIQTISRAGVEALLRAAGDAGLLADVTYQRNDGIADAATATLTISTDQDTYVHEAYALGTGGAPGQGTSETDPRRQALIGFLTMLAGDLAGVVGAENLGEAEPYEPVGYQLIAQPITDLAGFETEPRIEPWPAGTGVALAEATDCVAVRREDLGDRFELADELTFFTENDVTYQVIPRPAYPSRDC